MNRTILLALAGAAMITSAAADAKTRCTCIGPVKHRVHKVKHRTHKAVKRKTVVKTVVVEPVVVQTVVKYEDCMTPDSNYLPDPVHLDRRPCVAQPSENEIATRLNASLDIWRTCGWLGSEEPSAAFIAWSRTHVETDPKDPTLRTIAWKPFSSESFDRTEALTDPRERSEYCAQIRPDRTHLRAQMDTEMNELRRAHFLAGEH